MIAVETSTDAVRAVLATLPLTFRDGVAEPGDRSLPEAAVLSGPLATSAEQEVPDDVWVDYRWASNEAIARAVAAAEGAVLVELTAVVAPEEDARDAVAESLALLAALRLGISSDLQARTVGSGLVWWAQAAGARVAGRVVTTAAMPPRIELRASGPERVLELRLGDRDDARPALVRVSDRDGSDEPATPWESTRRQSWRRIGEAVESADARGDAALLRRIRALVADAIPLTS
jgi:hypothetical protein